MRYFNTILAALLLAETSLCQLSRCPSGEERLGTPSGSLYAVCQQADFRGTTTQFVDTVATLSDCAQACERRPGCTQAVYDKINFGCHLKASTGLTWVADPRFTTIKWLQKFQPGSNINDCVVTERNVTSEGTVLATCSNADYRGNTLQAIGGVASLEACASECGRSSRCSRAVYDKKSFQCYIKDDPAKLQWTFQPGFDTIRKISSLVDGSPISTCPSNLTTIDVGNNAAFDLCKNADFAVPSIDIAGGIPNVEACGARCASRQGCVHAVFDNVSNTCHLKGNLTNTNWMFNRRFSTLQFVGKAEAAPVSRIGRWSQVIQFPIIPVAAYVVPSTPVATRLLVFSSWGDRAFSGPTGITQFAEYDFSTGAVSKRTITNTQHDMFCPGISAIGGGKIVITGGSNAEAVSIYDPATNAFTKAANMVIPRGYQSSATLSDGRVFTIGGSFTGGLGGKKGEVYDPALNRWTLLQGADPAPFLTKDREGIWREDNHAWLFGWRDGSIFQAGPSKAMNWYFTNNGGSHVPAGNRGSSMDQMCGINVMYDVGKILSAGGSQDYTDSPATKEAHVIRIGNPGAAATVTKTADMNFARGYANAVVLPDGKVLVTGGQKRSLVFTDTDSVLVPEVWDPQTGDWTQLAAATVPRNYHSVSLLLSDGTVFVGGGGMCPAAQGDNLDWCDRAKDHFDGEIFSPPYLFATDGKPAPRPVITNISSSNVRVGASIAVSLQGDPAGVSFVLVRMGSATHSINSDQRRVPITEAQKTGTGAHSVRVPNDSGVVLPGPWYLFVMSKDGVPSVARTVMITS